MWRLLGILSRIRRGIEDERGVSLIEIIIVVLVLGITIVPLSQLSVSNLKFGGRYATMTKAFYHAEEVMEQIIADYAAGSGVGRGYDWVRTNWPGATPNPPTGLSGSVSISVENTLNGVDYVVVQITVSGSDIPDVTLSSWLVDDN